jgi:hypothetical protein
MRTSAGIERDDGRDGFRLEKLNWLRVLGTAELAQIDQGVCQQFHAIVPLLDTFKAEQQSLELIFPRKGALHAHPQRMDGFIEEAFASALRGLPVAGILFDIGDEARIENALAIVRRIKAAIQMGVGLILTVDLSPIDSRLITDAC